MAELFAPVFNLLAYKDKSPAARQTLVNRVMEACQTQGMFQVYNHGISDAVLENAMSSVKEFYELPTEELRRVAGIENSKCMLYTSTYAHALGVAQPPLYWRDVMQLGLNDEVIADGWPTLPESLRPNIWDFARNVELIERGLLSVISEGLGLGKTYFDTELSRASHIVVNQYPRCPEPTMALGMPGHCDPGVLTISFVGDVPGTQICVDGEWRQVMPSANSLLVTVGHQLEVISNGALKAPIHREIVNSERARTTISRVVEPTGDYVVGPARELLTTTNPARYKNFKYEDYFQHHVLDYKNTSSILERYYMISS